MNRWEERLLPANDGQVTRFGLKIYHTSHEILTSLERYPPKVEKIFDSLQTIVYNRTNFCKEVISGASFRGPYAQEILKSGCSGGLGKAHIPEPLDKAGKDHLGNGLLTVNYFQPHSSLLQVIPSLSSFQLSL